MRRSGAIAAPGPDGTARIGKPPAPGAAPSRAPSRAPFRTSFSAPFSASLRAAMVGRRASLRRGIRARAACARTHTCMHAAPTHADTNGTTRRFVCLGFSYVAKAPPRGVGVNIVNRWTGSNPVCVGRSGGHHEL
ncbi:hypothetical protein Y027_5191 [Burkholderia pseudomallei TSV5]|nr:hypothetical protein Y027_5191 [Burkholderia pseudomallei TSV5]